MSFPYPQDRHRDRREKGEHPYKDAREAMAQETAKLKAEALGEGPQPEESAEERVVRMEQEAQERFREVHKEISEDD